MIEIEKLSKQNKKFGLKLFASYIIFTLLLLSSIIAIHLYFSKDSAFNKFQRETKLQSSEKKSLFKNYFKNTEDSLKALAKNEFFIKYAKDNSYSYYIDLLFLTLMEANKDYMQMRFINNKGQEVIRFDRNEQSHEPYKSGKLQNKASRYYFVATSNLKKNQVWFSELDLNIEHGVIEKPHKPVVRIATPIYNKNEYLGVLIFNIFVEELLKKVTSSSLYDIYLVDEAGYYIKHKSSKYDWSIYDSKRTMDKDFEENIVYKILSSKKSSLAITKTIYIEKLHLYKQNIHMLLIQKEEETRKLENNNKKMILTILIFATLMAICFTFIFTRNLKSLFEYVLVQRDKLHELAQYLEQKVTEKTAENAKKDRLLYNQSKLAELGDMIGNIAHQWRHPLTRLSLTLQNISAYKKRDKLSDIMFEDAMKNSLEQIEFMSNTIDNFKDFYKVDSKKSTFIINKAITNVLNIVGSVLKHSNIELKIIDKENLEIFANKNEFSHVLMNLIINSKEALDENKIHNPYIKISIFKNNYKTVIEVKDNALGIKEDIITKIFNPYFTTKEDKGTGIGLYLSKAIIEEKLHGKLKVRNYEDGAIFTIII